MACSPLAFSTQPFFVEGLGFRFVMGLGFMGLRFRGLGFRDLRGLGGVGFLCGLLFGVPFPGFLLSGSSSELLIVFTRKGSCFFISLSQVLKKGLGSMV